MAQWWSSIWRTHSTHRISGSRYIPWFCETIRSDSSFEQIDRPDIYSCNGTLIVVESLNVHAIPLTHRAPSNGSSSMTFGLLHDPGAESFRLSHLLVESVISLKRYTFLEISMRFAPFRPKRRTLGLFLVSRSKCWIFILTGDPEKLERDFPVGTKRGRNCLW